MGRKQSGFAKRIRREFDIEMQLYVNNRMQMAEDAALWAIKDWNIQKPSLTGASVK